MVDAVGEQGSVGEAGQRVVERLVVELDLTVTQACHRRLQLCLLVAHRGDGVVQLGAETDDELQTQNLAKQDRDDHEAGDRQLEGVQRFAVELENDGQWDTDQQRDVGDGHPEPERGDQVGDLGSRAFRQWPVLQGGHADQQETGDVAGVERVLRGVVPVGGEPGEGAVRRRHQHESDRYQEHGCALPVPGASEGQQRDAGGHHVAYRIGQREPLCQQRARARPNGRTQDRRPADEEQCASGNRAVQDGTHPGHPDGLTAGKAQQGRDGERHRPEVAHVGQGREGDVAAEVHLVRRPDEATERPAEQRQTQQEPCPG